MSVTGDGPPRGAVRRGSAANHGASRLARADDRVVVTANYRLGAYGYLARLGLTAEAPDSGSGDYGLTDQQAARAGPGQMWRRSVGPRRTSPRAAYRPTA
ncbi:carboxylesterase family protein [Streptomyces angustmyceticus]|uniref:Carboxylesterase type B domain-containing protein n=1 Tax=Streptomyces angustmyceticus TaxID=285578 RepID=A0A5J4LEH4_9ACTN|nr:carboxylesterase family protein [Streptomyces angustmyceticus]GES32567.1 hypothetical protein San01_50540 [Streptomyces angustmyceticus]